MLVGNWWWAVDGGDIGGLSLQRVRVNECVMETRTLVR